MENCKGAVIVVLRRSYENHIGVEVLSTLYDNSDQAYEGMYKEIEEEVSEYKDIYGDENVEITEYNEIKIRRGTDTFWIVAEFSVSEVF